MLKTIQSTGKATSNRSGCVSKRKDVSPTGYWENTTERHDSPESESKKIASI